MRISDLCKEENNEILIRQYEAIRKYLEVFDIRDDEREEILQETVITVWRKIDDLRDLSKIDQWARSIARNNLKKLYKKRKRDLWRNLPFSQYENIDEEDASSLPGELVYHQMESFSDSEIYELVMQLGEPSSTILTLHYAYKESFAEIADTLKMKPSTVRSIAMRSRAKLERKIKEGGINHEKK